MNYKPYVPEKTGLREFTLKAVILGVILTVVLGAANAYLGLRAGMTIAATYPAAVIGMAVLKLMRGSHPRREHGADHRLDRRVRGRGGHFHDPGVRHRGRLAEVRHPRRLSQIERPDVRRRAPGHPVRDLPAPGHGHRPRARLPRVGGRLGDPQGRPERQPGRQVPVPGDGRGGARLRAGRNQNLLRLQGIRLSRSGTSGRASSAWERARPPPRWMPAGRSPWPARASIRPTSASATSSARASLP